MLRDYHYYLALVFQWIINEYLLSVRHSSSNYEILKNGLPSLLCFQGSCNWEIMELLKIIYHWKHSPQASGIIIIIIILHMNTRRFNIKCLAQCHLTKSFKPSQFPGFWTPEPHAISLPAHHGSENVLENVSLFLFFLRISFCLIFQVNHSSYAERIIYFQLCGAQ